MHSVAEINILRRIDESELYLQGDPAGQLPLFALPLRRMRNRKGGLVQQSATVVDYAARHCAKLLKHGLIEPMTAGADAGDRRFQISEKGQVLLRDLTPPVQFTLGSSLDGALRKIAK